MKKISATVSALVLMIAMLCTPVSATTPGTSAGNYYYTDIVTYLWDAAANAINIGGVTLIDAESMRHYGFIVNWHADTRRLEILDKQTNDVSSEATDGSLLDMRFGRPGNVAGTYYYTDIKTTLNGKDIISYNIGGRTFIGAEAMRDFGYNVVWDSSARTLRIQRSFVTSSFTITSLDFSSDELYKITGGGTADKKYTVTVKVPSSWNSKQTATTPVESRDEPYIASVSLYNFSSKYSLPNAMLPYNTKQHIYSEDAAKHVVLNEKLKLSEREVLAEHISANELYGVAAYIHDYYVRVDEDYVLKLSIVSSSMGGESERRQVIESIEFSY